MESLKIIAHRGAKGQEPENTLKSFQRALELGAQALECDVHLSSDGRLMVIHDFTLERTTNGKGDVSSKSFDELRNLNAGLGEKIPTLDEVIEIVGKHTELYIELKGRGLSSSVIECVKTHIEKGHPLEQFCLSSFRHDDLAVAKKLFPELRFATLIYGVPLHYAECANELGISEIHASIHYLHQKFMEDARLRKLQVYAYTVNSEDEYEQAKALGVDAIFTDYPEKFLPRM